jgi:putative drug exporter of the RND superfamily
VRSVLVTALNLDIGERMWWPSALAHRPVPAADQVAREESVAVS